MARIRLDGGVLTVPEGLFKRFRYSLPFVPGKKKELYAAECFFWLHRAAPALGATTIG